VATTDGFLAYVVELFASWAAVETKRMFGGAAVMRGGRMMALIADDQIYLKVNDATRPAFEAAGSRAFVFETKGGGSMTMSYWALPPEALDDTDALKLWADRAWSAAAKAKSPAKAAKPRALTGRVLADLPLKSVGKGRKAVKKR
jgi:DNA transformation protein and related proteins